MVDAMQDADPSLHPGSGIQQRVVLPGLRYSSTEHSVFIPGFLPWLPVGPETSWTAWCSKEYPFVPSGKISALDTALYLEFRQNLHSPTCLANARNIFSPVHYCHDHPGLKNAPPCAARCAPPRRVSLCCAQWCLAHDLLSLQEHGVVPQPLCPPAAIDELTLLCASVRSEAQYFVITVLKLSSNLAIVPTSFMSSVIRVYAVRNSPSFTSLTHCAVVYDAVWSFHEGVVKRLQYKPPVPQIQISAILPLNPTLHP